LSEKKVSRRRFLKYGAAGVVVVGAAAAGAYYLTQPSAPPTSSTTMAPVTSASTSSSAEPVTLNVATISGARYLQPWQALTPSFEAAYPNITVNYISAGQVDIQAKIVTDLTSGTGAYDIDILDYVYAGPLMAAGYMYSLNNFISDPDIGIPDYTTDYGAAARSSTSLNGTIYGLPTDGNCQIGIWRKDIFQAAGLTVPTTWDEVPDVAKALTKPPQYGYIDSLRRPTWASSNWYVHFLSGGGSLWDSTYHPTLNTDPGVNALNFMIQMLPYCPPGVLGFLDDDIGRAFSDGTGVFAPSEWGSPIYTTPSIDAEAANVQTGLIPAGTAGTVSVLGGLPSWISAASKHPREAYLLMRWMQLPENMHAFCAATGQPGRLSALADPVNVAVAPYYAALSENLKYAWVRPPIKEWADIDNAIGTRISQALDGELGVEAALSAAEGDVTAIFTQSGRITTTG